MGTVHHMTAAVRRALPSSAFALPGRRYPIHTRGHAKAALGRVAEWGTPHEQHLVRMAVRRRYPGMMGAHPAVPKGGFHAA